MSDDITIRLALHNEAKALSSLCWRSKAHWGYDAQFMELSREALTVAPDWIAAGQVIVAEQGGIVAGVAALAADENRYELAVFFVEPAMMGRGVGAKLYTAIIDLARRKNVDHLHILADPNAASFYEKMGAKAAGTAPSDTIPGRRLPVYTVGVTSQT